MLTIHHVLARLHKSTERFVLGVTVRLTIMARNPADFDQAGNLQIIHGSLHVVSFGTEQGGGTAKQERKTKINISLRSMDALPTLHNTTDVMFIASANNMHMDQCWTRAECTQLRNFNALALHVVFCDVSFCLSYKSCTDVVYENNGPEYYL